MKKEKDYIFGIHVINEALRTGKELDRILIARKNDSEVLQDLIRNAREKQVPFQFAPVERLNRITRKNHQGVIAFISEISYIPFNELITSTYESGKDPLLIMLDGVSDVRNLGAIARSAECMGFNGIIIPEKGSARLNADAIKTSAGALLRIPVTRVGSLPNSIKYLKDSGVVVLGVTEKARKKLYDVSLLGPLTLVMGNENKGISENLLYLCEDKINIPMPGETGSLNVSVAASIAMYEVLRQRSMLS